MAEALGLEADHIPAVPRFRGHARRQRARIFDRAERKFDLMQELGCDLLMVCSNVSPDSLGGIDRIAGDLHELGERAANRGLRVGFEALAWGRHINDYRDAWEVVRRADHPAVGLVLDSFHTFARKTDLKRDARHSRRPDLPGATRRRAAGSRWMSVLEPPFPQFPRTGRPARARLHGGARRHRLSGLSSRWRSSTTSSAPARHAASRSMASAR